ncbi:unnamed protein product, partial [marine sediment metagenome]
PEMGVGEFDTLVVNDGAGHFFRLPRLTTAQRDALTAQEGMVISNTTTDTIQAYINSDWVNMDPRLLTFSTTAHDANAAHRGMFYFIEGGIGVENNLYCIMKDRFEGYYAV